MKALVPVICTLITAGFGYLTATTAAGRSDDWTRYEARHAADSVRIGYLAVELAAAQREAAEARRMALAKRAGPQRREQPEPAPVAPQAQVVGVLARADSAARANPATAILPKRALTTRIARGLTGVRR